MKTKIVLAITGLVGMVLFSILALEDFPVEDGVFKHMEVVWAYLAGLSTVIFAISLYKLIKQ